jgi:2'-5' RNA ligase
MYAFIQRSSRLSEPEGPTRLFFSIFPDPPVAARISRTAWDLRRRYQLSGTPLVTSRFHSTLCACGHRDGISQIVAAKAREAAAMVRAVPFKVSFNCAKSFFGKEDHHPLVLTGDDGVIGLTTLYSSLCMAMRRVGLQPPGSSSFTPHVTIIYDRRRIDEQSIEPVCWTVGEFVLVLSLIGRTKYIPLGRWQLRG